MANQTSISITSRDQNNNKMTTSVAYVNPNATDGQLLNLADKLTAFTTNTVQEVNKVSRKVLIGDKAERNLSVKHNNVDLTEIQATDLPAKTDSSGQYLVNITFSGEGELWIRNAMTRTGEIYICCVEGVNAQTWLLDLRKNNSPSGTIQIMIPETDTYQSAIWTISVA